MSCLLGCIWGQVSLCLLRGRSSELTAFWSSPTMTVYMPFPVQHCTSVGNSSCEPLTSVWSCISQAAEEEAAEQLLLVGTGGGKPRKRSYGGPAEARQDPSLSQEEDNRSQGFALRPRVSAAPTVLFKVLGNVCSIASVMHRPLQTLGFWQNYIPILFPV